MAVFHHGEPGEIEFMLTRLSTRLASEVTVNYKLSH